MSLYKRTDSKIYFAHPYASYEHETDERHNGLIRRFIPKGESLMNYTVDIIFKVQNQCNTLPRKILNYLTPAEAFKEEVHDLLSV